MWCGGSAPTNEKIDAMAQALIVTANAFKLGPDGAGQLPRCSTTTRTQPSPT